MPYRRRSAPASWSTLITLAIRANRPDRSDKAFGPSQGIRASETDDSSPPPASQRPFWVPGLLKYRVSSGTRPAGNPGSESRRPKVSQATAPGDGRQRYHRIQRADALRPGSLTQQPAAAGIAAQLPDSMTK